MQQVHTVTTTSVVQSVYVGNPYTITEDGFDYYCQNASITSCYLLIDGQIHFETTYNDLYGEPKAVITKVGLDFVCQGSGYENCFLYQDGITHYETPYTDIFGDATVNLVKDGIEFHCEDGTNLNECYYVLDNEIHYETSYNDLFGDHIDEYNELLTNYTVNGKDYNCSEIGCFEVHDGYVDYTKGYIADNYNKNSSLMLEDPSGSLYGDLVQYLFPEGNPFEDTQGAWENFYNNIYYDLSANDYAWGGIIPSWENLENIASGAIDAVKLVGHFMDDLQKIATYTDLTEFGDNHPFVQEVFNFSIDLILLTVAFPIGAAKISFEALAAETVTSDREMSDFERIISVAALMPIGKVLNWIKPAILGRVESTIASKLEPVFAKIINPLDNFAKTIAKKLYYITYKPLVWTAEREGHVAAHEIDVLTKGLHGVFNGNSIELIDEAWKQRSLLNQGVLQPHGKRIFYIDYPNADWEGGYNGTRQILNRIAIVVEEGTSRIITGYPVR